MKRRNMEKFALGVCLAALLGTLGWVYAVDIYTVAGGGVGDGHPAVEAVLSGPSCVAEDAAGNLFITDRTHHRIRKVDAATGMISTVAGTGEPGYSGDGGPAVTARFDRPFCVAADGAGNLFVSDRSNHVIRRVSLVTGTVATVAGTGVQGYGGDGGPATLALLNNPSGLAVEPSGTLWIADTGNHRIRRLSTGGILTTVAGTGLSGTLGDGGPATLAQLNAPLGIAIGPNELYIADTDNHTVRHVDLLTGTITTAAGHPGIAWDWGEAVPPTDAYLNAPAGVSLAGGVLFIADTGNNWVRKVDGGLIYTVAGTGVTLGDGGPALNASLSTPQSVFALDAWLYIADAGHDRVRRVDLIGGTIDTIAGRGNRTFSGDGGSARFATLSGPGGMDFDASGNLYVADRGNNRVRMVDAATGAISTFAGTGLGTPLGDGGPAAGAALLTPYDVVFDATGNLYISDQLHHRVRRVDAVTGTITTVAGTGTGGYNGDSTDLLPMPANTAQLRSPAGLAVDTAGNLYIADELNHRIRMVDTVGNIWTVAGSELNGFGGDGGAATLAKLDRPTGISVDTAGRMYIADGGNHRIRMVDPAVQDPLSLLFGVITTVAGGGSANLDDGNLATDVWINGPVDVLAHPTDGSFYIAEGASHRVRFVDLAGVIFTTAGTADTAGFGGDGEPAPLATLNGPSALARDAAGTLYIADAQNNRVRMLSAANQAPHLMTRENLTVPSDAARVIQVWAVGPEPTDTLTLSATGLPGFAGIVDNGDGTGLIVLTPPLTEGAYPGVAVQVTDAVNSTEAGAIITVVPPTGTGADITPPVISGLVPVVAEAESAGGAIVPYVSPVATDDTDPNPSLTCTPLSGSTFPLGPTTVTCTATDASGNTSTGGFTVTVQDTTAPVISGIPLDITAEATGPGGATVTWVSPTANDLVDGPVTITCAPPSGSTFPIGPTTVTCTATDAAANTASAGFNVTVQDTAAPVISGIPLDITAEATGPGGATVTYTLPTASDLVDGTVTVTCTPPSGTTFPLGPTPVTCTATDAAANTATGGFTVTVQDTTAPLLGTLPADITVEAAGAAGTVVNYTVPSANDVVDGVVPVTCLPGSGGTFAIGTTIVTCSATDSAGNTASGSFSITVQDNTAPVISGVPADITAEATGPGGATVTYASPTASDAVDGPVTVDCTPASGSTFPLGPTGVVCSATDAAANTATGGFTVTVQDNTAPVISAMPADITTEATGPTGAIVTYVSPTADDLVDGTVAVTCTPASGFTFPLGPTGVVCSATDAAANTAQAGFNVTVQDNTAPVISGISADITTEATGPTGAIVTYVSPTASDLVDGTVAVTCTPASGDSFPLGPTTVTCTATDAAANTASAGFSVTVQDNTAPVLSGMPADMTVEATGPLGTTVGYTLPTATDLVDGTVPVACLPTPGAQFGIGTTPVSCSATDLAGNTANGGFSVTVEDTTPPLITLIGANPITVEAGTPYSDPGATASDLVSGDLSARITVTELVDTTIPGTGQVTYAVTDGAGNSATASRTVQVQDTTSPGVALTAPVAGAVLSGTVALSATATDPVQVARVDFMDGQTVLATDLTAPYGANWDTTLVPDGTHLLQAVAVDSSGNQGVSATVSVTVDNAPPAPVVVAAPIASVLSGIVPLTVSFDGSGSTSSAGAITAWDWQFGDGGSGAGAAIDHTFTSVGIFVITLTVTDAAGNTDSGSLSIEVLANPPPVLGTIGPRAVDEGQPLGFTVTATDPNGDPLILSATGLPTGATFEPATGAFAWTPGFDQAGDHLVTFAVTDGVSTDSETVTITVANVNRAPEIGALPDQSTAESTALTFDVTATDADGDPLVFGATGMPVGASYGEAGVNRWTFSWTPGYDQAGIHNVTFSVTDGPATTLRTVVITVSNTNRPPVMTAPGVFTMNEGDVFTALVGAADPDGDAVTLSASGLPPFCSFADLTGGDGELVCTPGYDQAGSHGPVTFTASDGQLSDQAMSGISVTNVNRLPVLTPIGQQAVDEWGTLAFTVNATDPDGDVLTFAAVPLPAGAAFDTATGAFNWSPVGGQAGNYSISFSVTDNFGTVSEQVSIAVTAVAPPVVQTGVVTWVTTDGARLSGTVDARGNAGNAWFEYGPTSAYGTNAASVLVGGTGNTPVESALTGLAAGSRYHYRLCAATVGPAVCGDDALLDTRSAALGSTGNIDQSTAATERRIDGFDLVGTGRAYGADPTSPNWNPLADLNGDGVVDNQDVGTVSNSFGQVAP